MRSVFRWIVQSVLALSLVAGASADPIDYGYLDARIRLLMQRDDMMGLGVAVVENGQIRFVRGYGYVEEGGSAVNTDTRFRWASVSKGLAATLAAELDQEGTLSLDDTVSQYHTTLRLPGFGENRATLRDVLSHRLGLVSNAYDNILESGREPSAIRQMLGDLELICPVSDCHGYQNVAFDTIEEVFLDTTGLDFETLARQRIFNPLGMRNASTTYEGFISSGNYARPHSWRSNRLSQDRVTPPYFRVAAAGGVSSSADDMARYLQAQVGVWPNVFSAEALEVAHTPVVETQREARGMASRYDRIHDADYALGWRVYDYEGHTVIGHRGAVRGFRALILFDPERQTGIAAMWNSNVSRPTGLQFELMDMVYGLEHRDWMRLMPEAGNEANTN